MQGTRVLRKNGVQANLCKNVTWSVNAPKNTRNVKISNSVQKSDFDLSASLRNTTRSTRWISVHFVNLLRHFFFFPPKLLHRCLQIPHSIVVHPVIIRHYFRRILPKPAINPYVNNKYLWARDAAKWKKKKYIWINYLL